MTSYPASPLKCRRRCRLTLCSLLALRVHFEGKSEELKSPLFTGRNEVVAKVMFLQASVILLTGGGACVVARGGRAWLVTGGACVVGHRGGMRGWSRGGVRGWSQGGHAWLVTGGMCGWSRGACMVGHRGACMVGHRGGMHGWSWGGCVVGHGGHAWLVMGGHAWLVTGGHAWLVMGGCVVGHGGGVFFCLNEVRSMSGRYASYWNAFLLIDFSLTISVVLQVRI